MTLEEAKDNLVNNAVDYYTSWEYNREVGTASVYARMQEENERYYEFLNAAERYIKLRKEL